MSYARFAIYYVPPEGTLAEFGATWLGWDVVTGRDVPQFDVPGLHDITMTPRKYGFHGTLKPPFRLADGQTQGALEKAAAGLAGGLEPATCEWLKLTPLGRFLALTLQGDQAGVRRVAEACVRDLDSFRAPASEAELARRRKAGLSTRQEALLAQWGYPYVFEEFRFHMTLSGRMPKDQLAAWTGTLEQKLPDMLKPFVMDQIALCGEREDGRFELLHRYTLSG